MSNARFDPLQPKSAPVSNSYYGAYIFDAASSVVEALLNFLEAFLLRANDEMAQLFVGVCIRRIAIAGGVIYRRVLGCVLLRGSALGLLGHVGRLQFLTG